MQLESNFESLSFDLFSLQENVMNIESDPDVDFSQNNISNFEAKSSQDFSINCGAVESFCLEMTNHKSKNILINLIYRPPNGDVKEFEKHLKYYQQMRF